MLRRKEGGRVGAYEILVGTNAVRNLIRENQIPQMYSMMQTGSRYGMITMDDAVKNLLEGGIIDSDEAHRALIKSSEESEDREEGHASGALGGGKMDEAGDYIETGGAGETSGGGYSF